MSGNLLLLALYSDHDLTGKLSLTSPDAAGCHGHLDEALAGSPPWFASAVPSRKPFWPTIYKTPLLIRKPAIKGFQSKKAGIFPLQPMTSSMFYWLMGSHLQLDVLRWSIPGLWWFPYAATTKRTHTDTKQ